MSEEEQEDSGSQSSSVGEQGLLQSHVSSSGLPRERREIPAGVFLTWNSKRVTARYLKAIAAHWNLPTKASVNDTRLAIEGKLREEGREPENVQVVVREREDGLELSLLGQDGVFMTCEVSNVSEVECGVSIDPAKSAVDGHDETFVYMERTEMIAKIEQLVQWNNEARERIVQLENEQGALRGALEESDHVIREHQQQLVELQLELESAREAAAEHAGLELVREQLKREKTWSKELWTLSCRRATEQEELLESKDEEIARLQARISELTKRVSGVYTSPLLVSTTTRASDPTRVTRGSEVHTSPLLVPGTPRTSDLSKASRVLEAHTSPSPAPVTTGASAAAVESQPSTAAPGRLATGTSAQERLFRGDHTHI